METGLALTEVRVEEPEGKKRGTVTSFPVDSRTTVLGETQAGLTSGFGMGPGKHYRCDRAPIFLRIGLECDDKRRNEI